MIMRGFMSSLMAALVPVDGETANAYPDPDQDQVRRRISIRILIRIRISAQLTVGTLRRSPGEAQLRHLYLVTRKAGLSAFCRGSVEISCGKVEKVRVAFETGIN
jgi:hypothetical protein